MMKKFNIKPYLLGLFLLTGCNCGSNDFREIITITSVKVGCDNGACCLYATSHSVEFYDTCGKFDVGDTIIIKKK
jgi:hypothetical protein